VITILYFNNLLFILNNINFLKDIKWKNCKLNDDNIKTTNNKPINKILIFIYIYILISPYQ